MKRRLLLPGSNLSKPARAWSLGALLFFGGVAGAGCGNGEIEDPSHSSRESRLPPTAVNQPLYAFLSKARAAHHRADIAEQSGDRVEAIGALRKITEGSLPRISPEVAEVLADAHARIADLLSQDNHFDEALHEIDEGVDAATDPTVFRGHLFEVRGVVLQRQQKLLGQRGDAAGAAVAKQQAIEAFEKAIDIQNDVIDRALARKSGTRRE